MCVRELQGSVQFSFDFWRSGRCKYGGLLFGGAVPLQGAEARGLAHPPLGALPIRGAAVAWQSKAAPARRALGALPVGEAVAAWLPRAAPAHRARGALSLGVVA